MPDAPVAVFRSSRTSACEERALVLTAVGMTPTIAFDGEQFVLEVEAGEAARALTQLQLYEREQRPVRKSAPPYRYPNAWVGCILYVLLLMGIAIIISKGLWRLDAFNTGELDAARVQSGQWWRAWTALTLHVGPAHLAGNLGAGVWFGYLAARQIGAGSAWLLIVTGAAFANLLEALLGPSIHRAVGASTAVFTALGLLAAHSWRTRLASTQPWAIRWAPLVAGVALLAWTGAGDASGTDGTDLVAHVLGFAVGAACGVVAALPWATRVLRRAPQWLPGLAAFASIAIAWAFALAS